MKEPTTTARLACLAWLGCLPWMACLAGCTFFYPDRRTPSDRARELQPKCAGFTEDTAAPLLAPSAVDSVEPAYSYVNGGPNGRDAHMRGARIHVRPLPGFSKESMARSLECHEARVMLGLVRPRADEPYTLPERWLDIDVDAEKDGFVVLVRTDAIEDATRVLERARHFAGAREHTLLPQSEPPSPGAAPVSAAPPASAAAPLSFDAGAPLSDGGQRLPLQ